MSILEDSNTADSWLLISYHSRLSSQTFQNYYLTTLTGQGNFVIHEDHVSEYIRTAKTKPQCRTSSGIGPKVYKT
jgi:hypothetical protein